MGQNRKFSNGPSGPSFITTVALAAISLAGCELSEQAKLDILAALSDPSPSPSPSVSASPTPSPTVTPSATPTPSPTPTAECYTDQFQQPAAQILNSVDILFVADTSGSMSNKRVKVANALYAFVGALPSGTDYRIGVILAHGSNDPKSGELYTSSGSIPKVLNSALLSQSTIQSHLKQVMLAAPDYNNEQGEMGSYALLKALSASKLQASRNLGFFRQDAALAIVTISDENDLCAVYPNPLPTNFTLHASPYSSMPGMTSAEKSIRQRDCPNGITSTQVINAVKAVQGDRPFVMGSVIHTSVNYSDSGGNDSYGWGYGQVVDESHGVLVDIANADYSSGLSSLGALTSVKIQLLSDFTLSRQNVNASTLGAWVDRNPVSFDYNSSQNEVHLFELGGARSDVEIRYCLNSVTPSPSPTVTPSPTSTVTPDPSPTPSPSPSATPEPSPTEGPTDPGEEPCEGPFCSGGGVIGI